MEDWDPQLGQCLLSLGTFAMDEHVVAVLNEREIVGLVPYNLALMFLRSPPTCLHPC